MYIVKLSETETKLKDAKKIHDQKNNELTKLQFEKSKYLIFKRSKNEIGLKKCRHLSWKKTI